MTAIVTLASYDPSDVRPGWIAFWVVIALAIATFLLWRSMNKQLRKINVPPRKSHEDADARDGDQQSPPTE
jgi:hypothetical protein